MSRTSPAGSTTRSWSLLVVLAAVLSVTALSPTRALAGDPFGEVTVTGLDPDGVSPDSVGMRTNVIAGSFGNFLGFTYTAGPAAADALSIRIPADWQGGEEPEEFSAAEERHETPGFARVKQGSCAAAGTLTAGSADAGASVLELVGFSCARGQSLSIELFYVTAPAEPGRYAFPTSVEGQRLPRKDQPSLRVHPVPDIALVVSGVPATVEYGEPFDVLVTAVKENGKVDRGYRGTIRFVGDCADVAPDDYTFTQADRGRHVVSGIELRREGEHPFGFRDVGNTARPAEAVSTVTYDGEPPPGGCGVRYH